jgi:hypothetical protein
MRASWKFLKWLETRRIDEFNNYMSEIK